MRNRKEAPHIREKKIVRLLDKGKHKEAIRACRQLCQRFPDEPDVWYLYSKASSALGNKSEAIDSALHALTIDPLHIDSHKIAGDAYLDIGQAQTAVTHFQKIVKQRPDNAVALFDLGRALKEKGSRQEALQCMSRAVAMQPDLADARMILGYLLKDLGFLVDAINSFKAILSIYPDRLDAKLEIGACLQMMGEFNEALETFDEILIKEPDNRFACAGKAYVLVRMGEKKRAYKLIAPLMKKKYLNTQMLTVFAMIAPEQNKTEEAIQYLNEYVAHQRGTHAVTPDIYHELGKLYEHKEEYDKAFDKFRRSKQLVKQSPGPDPYINAMRAARKQFNSELFADAPRSDNTSELPVFIVGMPRSGTSLVEKIISSHSRVYGAGELPDLFEAVANIRKIHHSRNMSDVLVAPISNKLIDYEAIKYLDKITQMSCGASRVIDKMPHNFVLLGLIALLFPKARVIHCKRDPLDTCLSIYFNPFSAAHGYANRLEDIGNHYREYEKLMDHWKKVLPVSLFEVQYEDLVENQESVSKQLIEFCGLKWEHACIKFYKSDQISATMSYDQVSKPIYRSSIGRWTFYEKHLASLKATLESE